MKTSKVCLVATQGKTYLDVDQGDRLLDCLHKNQIPWSAVTIYKYNTKTRVTSICPSLEAVIENLSDNDELHLYYNRNVDPFHFIIDNIDVLSADGENQNGVAEFIYRKESNKTDDKFILKKLSENECRQVVSDSVHKVLSQNLEPNAKLIVGISGGGDSNALLDGLLSFSEFKVEVIPVILKGIPDWDWGVPRAQALCDKYGLKLRIMEENEVKGLLKLPEDDCSLIDRFEKFFPDDDYEFLGTTLITLALLRVAKEEKTPYICTGSNLEDMLSEGIYRLSNGKHPLPMPMREAKIEGIRRLFPLWLVPKKIIDGCYPKYSIENYSQRYPCISFGRTLYYQVANYIQSAFPSMAERILMGLSEMAKHFPLNYKRDPDLGFPILEDISFPLKNKYMKMINADFRKSAKC